ncbi:hypothetical protein M1O53_04360 [Dehalococcoidia bacterium]|nr:hypothetical protein [Dehalococcoidia bacterium]
MKITRQKVAQKLIDYLSHRITLLEMKMKWQLDIQDICRFGSGFEV